MTVQELRARLEQKKGQRLQIERDISSVTAHLTRFKRSLRQHERAREIIRLVALKTQQQLSFHISNVTSLVMESIYDDPYQLKVDFVQRRNKTECDLFFERDGERVSPLEASGGGVVDVAALALRVTSWSMQRPQSNNVLILDEPFKHLKGEEANRRALDLMREICRRMHLQVIMVADERVPREDLLERSDRAFEVTIRRCVSQVKQI